MKEKEEYNKWKGKYISIHMADMFSIDEVGDRQEEDAEYENKLQVFIDYI